MNVTLETARKLKGFSIEQAANEIGVSKKTLWLWEKREKYPSKKYIPKIEEVYGIEYDIIIFLPSNTISSHKKESNV